MERRHHETQGGKSGYCKAKSVSRAHHPTDRGAFSHVGGTGCYGVAPVSLCAGQNGRNDAGMVGDTLSPAGRGVVVLRTASSVLVQMLGCLVVTEDEIVWKCPFMRTVRLRKTEIRYTGIDYRWPGSARKAVTPVDMAYFSTKSYPQECRNKSYLLRNKKGFIKFPAGEKLCRYMSEWLPEPYERVFAAASDGYEARRRKRDRKRGRENEMSRKL